MKVKNSMKIGNIQIDKNFIKQFGSYLIVGLIATIVEWAVFYLLANIFNIDTYLSVALSFIVSTFANWLAGRLLTFKNAENKSMWKEILSIYGASVIGLLLNELIMWLLLSFVFIQKTSFQKMMAKVIATAIVFFWNFLIRKLYIYKDKKEK
jgi:putative flippase GtrA